MGLLSLFQRRNGEAATSTAREPGVLNREPPTPARGMLWRCGAMETYALGEHVQAVRRGSEPPKVLPAFAVEFASACQEWKTLEDHVGYYAGRHGWDPLQVESLYGMLPRLQEAGALISAEQVLHALGGTTAPGTAAEPRISIIGFPTGGDRSALLDRAIRSFAANLQRYGREAQFLVADSSVSPAHTDAFRSCLAGLARELSIPVAFCSAREKEQFARELARAGACSYEAAEFALLDPLGTGFACGANRNALLLHGAGNMLCSIDDDVVCDLFRAPAAEHRMAFFSNRDPFSRWLFPDAESAERFAQPVTTDFLAAHEQMLGLIPSALAPGDWEECDFQNVRDRLLERIASRTDSTLQVRSTFLGHLGDPGIPTSLYYLYYDGENRRRLTATEGHYRSVFGSRSVHTAVSAPSIGDASVSPGMAMGLDHRELLPPFFPALHAEDFSWGAALWQCCGSALLGHIPLAIRHAPPRKPILTPTDLGENRRVVVFEWAHLLRYLIFEFKPAAEQSDAQRTAALGRYLSDLAVQSPRDFRHSVGEVILRLESQRLTWLERELREDTETPDYWRDDLERHIANVRDSLAHEDFDIPLDLKSKGSPQECRDFMQKALGRYGQLLQEWPDLVQGAATLRDLGQPLFRSVGPG